MCFGLGLTGTDILSAACAHLPPTDARRHLFEDIDPALAARLGTGDVIVAEELTGTAATARPAIAALAAAGVTAIVTRSVTPEMTLAARAESVVALIVDTPSFLRTNDRVRLDLDAAKIVNLSSGDRVAIRNLDDDARACLQLALGRRPPS